MKHPPYHLRTNKAVDRLLLVDILRAFGSDYNASSYYSLAGPFLEDLRVMDHFFPEVRLLSLESDQQTFKRQEFNQFCSRLELKKTTLADFLTHEYEPNDRDIFWLDYTDLKYQRFAEFQRLLTQVLPQSVIRITLRAEPEIDISALEDRLPDEELVQLRTELKKTFKNEFDKVLPYDEELISSAFEKTTKFARLVQLMVQQAASLALDFPGSEVDYLPLQSTHYNDNTQMVSVTGIICLRDEIEQIRTQLDDIRFANFDWREPDRIDVPMLSVKERLHLERHLPVQDNENAGEILYDLLEYKIERTVKRTKQQLAHYAECHRDYPNFVRISI